MGLASLVLAQAPEPDAPGEAGSPGGGGGHSHSGHGGDASMAHEDMPGMVQPSPVAYVATSTELPRSAWTVTASSEELVGDRNAAANALDGDPATFWHSQWAGDAAARLPQSITVDMHAVRTVDALSYLPRQDGSLHGTVTEFTVETSTDGVRWSTPANGRWAADAARKRAELRPGPARYVRLTVLDEASAKGFASAAELDVLTPAAGDDGYTTQSLDPSGWKVSADSEELAGQRGAATNAVDGDPATMWHTQWRDATPPLPHRFTIDLGRVREVDGLTYLPRQDGVVNGTVIEYRVETSDDQRTWTQVDTGRWLDDTTLKTARFTASAARYVRFTALVEINGHPSWTSAAEIGLLTPGGDLPDASKLGSWGPTITFPLVPSAAAVLPGNRVLTWSAYADTTFVGSTGQTQTAILDLTTGRVSRSTVFNTRHDMFCPGVVVLADGRIMVTGGSGASETSIYDPATDTWKGGPAMNVARGYQSMTLLPNGNAFTVGGSWSGPRGGKVGEVWSPAAGWTALPGVTTDRMLTADPGGIYRSDNHMWLFPTRSGRVLQLGPSRQMNSISLADGGSVTPLGLRADSADAMNGNAVLYDADKVLTVGGAPAYEGTPATSRSYTVDIGGSTPVTRRSGDLATPRAFANSVVLPDGRVVVVGGQRTPVPFTDTDAAMSPETWDPATGAFTTGAPMAVPRTYHSVALLLQDGRVLTGGGGLCGDCATNHPSAQIYSPDYLYEADGTLRDRPRITTAPTTAQVGGTVKVTTDRAVSRFVLVRMGQSTHSVNNDQRRVPLSVVSRSGTSYQLRVPNDASVALPGPYLLFALDSRGTPSVAALVTVPVPSSLRSDVLLPRTGWTVTASDAESVGESAPASNLLDGDAVTLWHSRWSAPAAAFPHTVTVDTRTSQRISGLSLTTRQDGSDHGVITDYRIQVSSNATSWTTVASGRWPGERGTRLVRFTPVKARYVRLVALGEASGLGTWASAAELNLL
jgi:galactose oxidase